MPANTKPKRKGIGPKPWILKIVKPRIIWSLVNITPSLALQ